MPFLSIIKKNRGQKSAGFTLIEILIIAPIVIIAISGFVALMISVVGKVLPRPFERGERIASSGWGRLGGGCLLHLPAPSWCRPAS